MDDQRTLALTLAAQVRRQLADLPLHLLDQLLLQGQILEEVHRICPRYELVVAVALISVVPAALIGVVPVVVAVVSASVVRLAAFVRLALLLAVARV